MAIVTNAKATKITPTTECYEIQHFGMSLQFVEAMLRIERMVQSRDWENYKVICGRWIQPERIY